MSKVYCKNCKWSGGLILNTIGWKWCEYKNEFTNCATSAAIKKDKKNFDGGCKDFKANIK